MFGSEADAIIKVLGGSRSLTVVNLGAHEGQERDFFRSLVGTSGKLLHIMVEPDPQHFFFLSRSISSNENIQERVFRAAISDATCIKKFRSADDGSGSLLEPTGDRATRLRFSNQFDVPCVSLDDLFSQFGLEKIDLLWVDIQGSERDMIKGGQAALKKTRYCFMEVESVPLYEGEALKPELLSLMQGWDLVGEFEYNVLLRNTQYPHD